MPNSHSNLQDRRRALQPLLSRNDPADAQAVYYAFHHPDEKVSLVTLPEDGARARGYVCLARTGADLFRPVMTMRLPVGISGPDVDFEGSRKLLSSALTPGADVVATGPASYLPLIHAVFEVQSERKFRLYVLDLHRFEPVINVLVTATTGHDGLPRHIIRSAPGRASSGEIVASAGLNWQSPQFAEIYVHTAPSERRRGYGLSVVAAVARHVIDSGRRPIYAVEESNVASMELAARVGFVDSGADQFLIEGLWLSPS